MNFFLVSILNTLLTIQFYNFFFVKQKITMQNDQIKKKNYIK